ncbi:hypothetical protein Q5H91_01045 [Sphingomonas sp. KR1UV-12]|uniref:Uncharacterized protein n=1 Tax=Sphingomonas aurea TaxID=3063994 RepID=A0ABT9EFX7_9SPHN|nr:hypothetical protein [Sphingomonas sp. KR1UV-12]MDP1025789.1 hypothetical protein [Sphingomonas sp. KR1UV-12]
MTELGAIPAARPAVLVIDNAVADRCLAAQAFATAGWMAVGVASDGWAAAGRAQPPSLVLVAGDGPPVAALRATPNVGEAPLVAWTREGLTPSGYDDGLVKPFTPAAIAALARRWRPDDPSAVLGRLEAALGRAEIAAMTAKLREQLRAALETGGRAEAHRIAGIAGMLGFAELGAAWLAVADGAVDALPPARIATRRALLALARRG